MNEPELEYLQNDNDKGNSDGNTTTGGGRSSTILLTDSVYSVINKSTVKQNSN